MPAADAAFAVRLDDVGVAHAGRYAVRGVSGVFERGLMHAVTGPNGAGKSSLVAAIAGHLPAEGRIHVAPELVPRIGWLPQRSQVDRSFPIDVGDFAAMGLWPKLGAWRGLSAADRDAVAATLTHLGLQGLQKRLIGELSVGQFQRLLFARLWLQDAALLLLDEPFAALDERTTDDLLAVLHGWQREGRTVVCVLHELALARSHFDRVLLLAREPIAWCAPDEALAGTAWARAAATLARHDDEAAPVMQAHAEAPVAARGVVQ